ncbi:hypothetical protein [Anaplasma phagocytophilum]|uniref:60Kd inner membrane family protein n=1 Tax=Anaplasma phagocytophilum str. CRT53-1 TaxID=1359157 RepID=A0A0F3Q0K4_ANAPH|nr:hypothetical protein [Anaplasma phagocytophilum]KDB57230.1 hypothetical protein P030_03830 [Anaplasma phagocytophilum str. CRT35]KJV86155.1 60Kd inner membrane family protein [Anaplasma phagocytophilum str. CRT53-1]
MGAKELELLDQYKDTLFKLKRLQPEVLRIKELYKTDDLRISKEIASLFKKHKVSPVNEFPL